jgi:exocyst complex component 3
MADIDPSTLSLSDLLRHPDDLSKIPAVKADIIRKKVDIDSNLREGLQQQVESIKSGLTSISASQKTVDEIKAEMQKIDKLCSEAQTLITDYPDLNLLSITLRNFTIVKQMKEDIETFAQRLEFVEQMLRDDELHQGSQGKWFPNLLPIHYELTKLRDFKDSALDQAQRSDTAKELISNLQLQSGSTLQEYFTRLDDLVDVFDEHLGILAENQLQLVTEDKSALVRLNLIIHDEEKRDKQSRALQDAKNEYQDLAGRFESITAPKRQIRGYKEKTLAMVGNRVRVKLDEQNGKFQEEPEKLERLLRFWFNDLNLVKIGMEGERLVPPKWKVFQSYSITYHKAMHDWLIAHVEDPELKPPQMLAIVNWSDRYYEKCKQLGLDENWLQPHVIDDRASDLIREYRELIIKAVDEWMDRMAKTDSLSFEKRDETALDQDEHGCFRTKTLSDMWRMLAQQIEVAASSQRVDIVEGVVDAMFRALQSRQRMWEQLIDSNVARYQKDGSAAEGYQGFQDWLIAIANDQIACIEVSDNEQGYLMRFSIEAEQLVSSAYWTKAQLQLNALKDGYVDLATHCLNAFASVIFSVDFRTLITEFFTPTWYSKLSMKQATTTFGDYLEDYRRVLHPTLVDILANELSSRLLSGYLSAVRNKGVKFRRADPFMDKFKADLLVVFEFFENFETINEIKQDWRAVEGMVNLLAEEKSRIPDVYQDFKQRYWDAGMSWVEAVLKARDDYERSIMNAVKQRAAAMEVVRGNETIMSKVK